jgi:LDH2 family malate/lactate/ureidoglycolate dehydrogenase
MEELSEGGSEIMKSKEGMVCSSPEQYTRFIVEVLMATGASGSDAEIVAKGMLWADLRGRHTQGLNRLPNIVKRLSMGLIRSPTSMVWQELGPAAGLLDAGHGLGHVSSYRAISKAVELARGQGVGLIAVRHSNHFGAAGFYCAVAAEAGCLSFNYTNSVTKVAPHGGRKPVVGTNPIAFGCPRSGAGPLLVDLSTSAISGGEASSKGDTGGLMPQGVALDSEGRPTQDPGALKSGGCLLPVGGARGYALGLMVEILSGVLTGSAVGKEVGSMYFTWDRPVDVGHVFIAVDIERFLPLSDFLKRLEGLLAWIASTPPMEGFESVRIPGQIRAELAEKYAREGIPVVQESIVPLTQLAQSLSIPLPWNQDY